MNMVQLLHLPSIRSKHLDTWRLVGVVAREVDDAMVVSPFEGTSLLSGDDIVPLENVPFLRGCSDILHWIFYNISVLLPQTLDAEVRRHPQDEVYEFSKERRLTI